MRWLVAVGSLPENLLLHLREEMRARVLDDKKSGQQRVNELFRLVQRRRVAREMLLAVAHQDDGHERARDARLHLRKEGILVLGH